ncbi:hypothetical protein BDW72DRAFT_199368 [Aspergillus terricola var. indicus]
MLFESPSYRTLSTFSRDPSMIGFDTLQPRTSRKSHRKSRLGCINCKRRHIKCDEAKPQCANCTSHSSVCGYSSPTCKNGGSTGNGTSSARQRQNLEYTFVRSEYQDLLLPSSSSPLTDTSSKRPQLQQDPPPFGAQFTVLDLKLQHQYLTSTCLTLAEDQGSLDFWQNLVPRVGYSFPFVLHLSLALAGLHMGRSPRSNIPGPLSPDLDNQIDYHYIISLRALSHALAHLTPHTSYPVWIGSILLCFISMARGPCTGNYLFFSTINNQPAEWISLLKGVQTLSCLDELRPHTSHKQNQPLHSFHAKEPEHRGPGPHLCSNDSSKSPLYPSCSRAIQSLTDLISIHCAADPLKEKYLATLTFIHQSLIDLDFPTCTPTSSSTSKPFSGLSSPTQSANPNLKLTFVIWTWTSLLDDGLDALQRKEPIPLLLLAYFLVLFKQLDEAWFARGWAEHILTGIEEVLDGVLDGMARGLLRWPKEVILDKDVC